MNVESENQEVTSEDLEGKMEGQETIEQEVIKPWNVLEDETKFKPFQVATKTEEAKEEQEVVVEQVVDDVEKKAEQQTIESNKVVENEQEKIVDTPSINEDVAIKFLAEQRGVSVEEFKESLKPKEQEVLDPETEAYLKFRKETGRSYQDFQQLQKDWTKEPQEDVLKHILKAKNPNLDKEEIDFLFNKKYSFDSELDEEDVVMEKKINLKTDYREALEFLESQKEQYKVVRRSDDFVPEDYKKAKEIVDNWQAQQKENEILIAKAKEDFEAKTKQVFTENFEGFKFKVGDQSFNLKPEDVNQAKAILTDVSNFDKMFFDQETGLLKDPEGYYKALYGGMFVDKLVEQAYNLGKASQVIEDEKESKNIVVEGVKNINPRLGESPKQWKVLNEN